MNDLSITLLTNKAFQYKSRFMKEIYKEKELEHIKVFHSKFAEPYIFSK